MPKGYKARPEQAILFTVSAWDANCPQHIPQRFKPPTSPPPSPSATGASRARGRGQKAAGESSP